MNSGMVFEVLELETISGSMKRVFNDFAVLALAAVIGFTSCGNDGGNRGADEKGITGNVDSREEGVVLRIADAGLIQVDDNPGYNTAEWLFTVDKPGRYEVWLSTLTIDTTSLHFNDNVIITAGETRLAKKPIGDEIVTDDQSVKKPWFRADAHMGSIFFANPGEYPVQVISDRVEPYPSDVSQLSMEEHTLIASVILKPTVN